MRYILDDRGYVKYCSNTYITCENKTCTPYEGDIPDGYETIEEWVQNANIRAYKIEDGNLVFDRAEDSRLRKEYEELSKNYSTTEKIIGTWEDGSTLYQKTYRSFEYVESTSFDDIKLETNTNISIKRSYGYVVLNDFTVNIPTPDVGFGAISNVNHNPSGLVYMNRSHGSYGTLQDLAITIEYTKTTD